MSDTRQHFLIDRILCGKFMNSLNRSLKYMWMVSQLWPVFMWTFAICVVSSIRLYLKFTVKYKCFGKFGIWNSFREPFKQMQETLLGIHLNSAHKRRCFGVLGRRNHNFAFTIQDVAVTRDWCIFELIPLESFKRVRVVLGVAQIQISKNDTFFNQSFIRSNFIQHIIRSTTAAN